MDPLVGLLDGPRARRAFLLRSVLEPPWSLSIQDEAPLTVVAQVKGSAWVVPGEGDAQALGPGDAAILRGPDPYVVADDPSTPVQVVINPGQRCTTVDGHDLDQRMDLGLRTWGNSPHGSTVLLTGTYQMESEIGRRIISTLPQLVILRRDDWESPIVPILDREISRDEPGQEAILDRLLDLLLIDALRTWYSRSYSDVPNWYVASSDAVVGPALRMLQHNPGSRWTVSRLAYEVGVSRATLAKRFNDLVGEPPMSFLTGWRIALAADLLRSDDSTTLRVIAAQVGYGSPFALSAAFKRVHGISPSQFRAGIRR